VSLRDLAVTLSWVIRGRIAIKWKGTDSLRLPVPRQPIGISYEPSKAYQIQGH
jgi:hypothetical protein